MTEDRYAGLEARIRERAYHIWLEEGRPDGRDGEHWRRAERELIERETGLREDPPTAVTTRGAKTRAKREAADRSEASRRASRSGASAANAATGSESRSGRRPASSSRPAQ